MTTRNETALRAKQSAIDCFSANPQMEAAESVAAKSSGPMTRATLNWMEFSATAFGRSFLSTSDGTSVW